MKNSLLLVLLVAGCGGSELGPCPLTQPKTGDACAFGGSCYYYDACTDDNMGITALCTSGRVEMGYDLVVKLCPASAPKEGDPCPCVEGGRQKQTCDYACSAGSRHVNCDAETQKWHLGSCGN